VAAPPATLTEAELAAATPLLLQQPQRWAALAATLPRAGGPWALYWSTRLDAAAPPGAVRQRLREAFDAFEAAGDTMGALLAAAAAIETFYVDETALQPLDDWVSALQARLPADGAWPSLEIEAQVMAAGLAITLRDQTHPLLARWAARGERLLLQLRAGALRTRLATFVLQYQLWRGGFAGAWALLHALPGLGPEGLAPADALSWHETVATLARLAGEPARGRAEMAAALTLARREGLRDHLYALHTHAAAIEVFALDADAAQVHLDAMKPLLAAQPPEDQTHFWHYHAGIALARGDAPSAVTYARTTLGISLRIGGPYRTAAHRLSLGQALLAAGDAAAGLEELVQAEATAREIDAAQLVAAALLHRSATLAALGRNDLADAAQREAMAEIARRGFRSTSGWLLPTVQAERMARALRLGIEPALVRRWIGAHRLRGPDPTLAEWPWPLALRGLGEFSVLVRGEPLDRGGGRSAERPLDLLRALLAHGPAALPVATVLQWLWPDSEAADQRKAFDVALLRLRRLLGEDKQRDLPGLLRLEGGRLALAAGVVWTDVAALALMLERPLPQGDAVALRERADGWLALLRGPLLPDLESPWAQSARERLRQRFALAFGALIDALQPLDEAGALLRLETAFDRDPASEMLARRLMRCHMAGGRPGEAARVLRLTSAVLMLTQGLPPAPETRLLAKELGLASSDQGSR
jgi:LuxR family transcriptional regulator, maltose regulon positive regulatory protein